VALADGAERDPAALPAFRNGAGAIACPVMGQVIATAADAVSYADHEGTRYYFCCDSCEKLFLEEPETYADGKYLAEHALDPTAAPSCSDAPPG
jgi:YHS domain-containing protein